MKRITILFIALICNPAWATCDFRADTARTYPLKLVDGTDGITAETGLTVAQADVRLWKEGGTTAAQKNDATSCTHRESGWYTCPMDATDANTEGVLVIFTDESVNAASVVPWEEKCNVLGADEYDRKYGATTQLTSSDFGLLANTTIDTVTNQVSLILSAGAVNDGAYPVGSSVFIKDVSSTEVCETTVASWDGDLLTLGLVTACEDFTVAATDTVRIFAYGSARGQQIVDDEIASSRAVIDTIDTATGTDIPADIATVDANVDAILVDTGTTIPATLGTPAGADMSADIAAITVETPDVMVTTTIAGLTDQRTFTLTAGSADDRAYAGCSAIITDASTPTQKAYASIQSYTGSTKEVKLRFDPGVFTIATTDNVSVMCGPVMR